MGVALYRCCPLLALAAAACANGDDGSTAQRAGRPSSLDRSAIAPDTRAGVVFFPRIGNPSDDTHGSRGPGVVLMNGGLRPASAITFMHDAVDKGVAADVVVLCTHGDDVYSTQLYAMAPFNSVQTVLVPPESSADDVALVAHRLESAEIVFLADGDTGAYASWTGGPLAAAVTALFDRGGVVGASGAGAAALGTLMLTADVDSATALTDPYAASIHLVPGPFALPILRGTLVDLRVRAADHLGRLAALTARAIADGSAGTSAAAAMGIGLDDGAAIGINRSGTATLLLNDAGAAGQAWLVHGGAVDRIVARQPLIWRAAKITRFDAPGESLVLSAGCGSAFSYEVAIDGSATPAFTPADPYEAMGTATLCP
ncbi:MAG TPA: hypothetical protein VIF15_18290 [Polyangiaceae bacterium]|jgi:cyanophycinase-like exopeptidase